MLDTNDNDRAVMGGNNPPPYDPQALADLNTTVSDFLAVTKTWLGMDQITTEAHAAQLTDQIDGLRKLHKRVDEARKDAKKPHDEAGNAVQAAFAPLLDKLKRAGDALKPKLGAYIEAKAKREEEDRQREREEAERLAKAAEEAAAQAAASGDIGAQVDAEEAAKAAADQMKAAEKPVTSAVRSASGAGRTMSTRTVKEVTVTNPRVLFMRYQDHPDMLALLQRLASAEVRAAGYDPKTDPIAGIEITERKVVA